MTGFSQPERRALQRTQLGALSSPAFSEGGSGTAHPDADLLTAFAEHSLTTREHDQVLGHLAACASCREVVALAGSPLVEPVPEPARKRGIWEMPLFHWGAVAATTVVVVAAVSLGVRERRNQAFMKSEQPPAAFAQKEDKAVAEPRANTQPPDGLEANAPATAPTESTPSAPRRSLHLQQEARYERPSNETAKKQEVASAAIGGVVHGNIASGAPVNNSNTSDFLYNSNSNTVVKDKAADVSQARAVPPPPPPAPPATLAQNVPVSGASEMVTVEPGKGEVKTDQSVAAARVLPQAVTSEKLQGYSSDSMRKSAAAKSDSNGWQISNGKLQRSAGTNWQTVLPDQTFRTFALVQPHVWAGGDNGLLYHSRDNGQTWTPVSIKNGTTALSGNIVSLRFADTQNGSLQTSTSETWTTSDGGQSWQKK